MYAPQTSGNQGQMPARFASQPNAGQNVYQQQNQMVSNQQQQTRFWTQQQQQPSSQQAQQQQQIASGQMGPRAGLLRSPPQQRMPSPRYPMGQPQPTGPDQDMLLSYQQPNDFNGHPQQQQQPQQELTPQDQLSKFVENL